MKLGISYNVFDGEELLKASAERMRLHADYISVVYQLKSNSGRPALEGLIDLLEDIRNAGIIDEIALYAPNLAITPALNEVQKRNIGLNLSRAHDCTHHLSMDTDEFYFTDQYANALFEIEMQGYDNTACQMQTYYKRPELRIVPPEDYWVTFVTKIHKHSEFKYNGYFPVLVDPTRRMNEGDIYCPARFHGFKRSELEMHHMSYVRKDLRRKLENSSANANFISEIDQIVDHWENFEDGDQALFAGCPIVYHDLIEGSNDFSINI